MKTWSNSCSVNHWFHPWLVREAEDFFHVGVKTELLLQFPVSRFLQFFPFKGWLQHELLHNFLNMGFSADLCWRRSWFLGIQDEDREGL